MTAKEHSDNRIETYIIPNVTYCPPVCGYGEVKISKEDVKFIKVFRRLHFRVDMLTGNRDEYAKGETE